MRRSTTASESSGVIAGQFLQHPPTLHALGFEWRIDGDTNHDAVVEVTYRKKGASQWKPALPLLRVGDEEAGTPEMRFVTPRLFAGSILFLDPTPSLSAGSACGIPMVCRASRSSR